MKLIKALQVILTIAFVACVLMLFGTVTADENGAMVSYVRYLWLMLGATLSGCGAWWLSLLEEVER